MRHLTAPALAVHILQMSKKPPIAKKVRVECRGSGKIALHLLSPLQGNLKSLSDVNYAKLKAEIETFGFSEPISIWEDPDSGKVFVLNGHQRLETLTRMKAEGWRIPQIPVSMVEAADIKEARRKILGLASQFGTVEQSGLQEFAMEIGITAQEIAEKLSFPEINIESFVQSFEEMTPATIVGSGEMVPVIAHERQLSGKREPELVVPPQYTKKIKAPVYQITGEKPELFELFDLKKSDELLQKIQKSPIPDSIKPFLRAAAHRHTVFNYQAIAEYYAHAPKDVQLLMEDSALVVIDFKKAIESGFVQLTKDLAENYEVES